MRRIGMSGSGRNTVARTPACRSGRPDIADDLKPGEGAPPHLHREYDEYFFVVEGSIFLVVDGKASTIVPGTLAFMPRGAIHTFKNIGPSTASMLEWTVPGGNEPYFRAVAEMGADIDPKRLAEINAQFATEFVGS